MEIDPNRIFRNDHSSFLFGNTRINGHVDKETCIRIRRRIMNQPIYHPVYHPYPQRLFTLKELRQLSHMTVDTIATKMDVTSATLFAWESGKTQIPLSRLRELLVIYNVSAKDLDWDHIFNQIEKNKRRDD